MLLPLAAIAAVFTVHYTALAALPTDIGTLPSCHSCVKNCNVSLAKATGLPWVPKLTLPAPGRHFQSIADKLDVEVINNTKGETLVGVSLNKDKPGCRTFAVSTKKGAKGPSPQDTFFWWNNEKGAANECVWHIPKQSASGVSSVYVWQRCPPP